MVSTARRLIKSREWIAEHSKTIGGSTAAAVVGASRFSTPLDAYTKIRSALDGVIQEPSDPTDDMRRGTLLEHIALELLEEAIEMHVVPHAQDIFVYNTGLPFAHALPDGWVPVRPGDQKKIVEVKCPRPGAVARANLHGLPREYEIQAMHNMSVCNASVCYVTLLDAITMRVHVFPVAFDQVFSQTLMDAEREFYDRVVARTPPAPDEVAAIEAPPAVNGPVPIFCDADMRRAAINVLRLRALRDDAADAYERAKQRLLTMIPDRVGVETPDVFEVSGVEYTEEETGKRWSNVRVYNRLQNGRRTFLHDKACSKHPDLKEPEYWKQGEPFRSTKLFAC